MRRHRLTSQFAILLALSAAMLSGLLSPASAEQARRTGRKSQPAPVSRSAPDVTATIPEPKPTAAPALADPPLKPFFLPTASRPRVRTCGLKWQSVKMSGNVGDATWREFATKCLAERDDAGKKPLPKTAD